MSDFTFLNVLDDSLDYFMDHTNPGKCLIFDHEHFKDPKKQQRKGTKTDVKRIDSFFKERLGFEVIIYHDLTKADLVHYTQMMANQDFTHDNCLVVCILTHGSETGLEAFDGEYKLEQIISFFKAERCPSLAGKPKLFFIQACQGKEVDPGHDLRLLSDGNGNQKTGISMARDVVDSESISANNIVTVKVPICADILVAYSTVPKYYSYRNSVTGSWFFEVLMEVFEHHYKEHDLLTILTITKRRIAFEKKSASKDLTLHDKKQIPWITDTLTRRVFFKKLVAQTDTNYLCC